MNNNLEVLKSKSHPIIAGICDFYIIGVIMAAFLAIVGSITRVYLLEENILLMLGFVLISFILVVLYHSVISKKLLWLSPGELIAGRKIIDNNKEWINPYYCNRFWLFFIIIISVIILGNEFDGISKGIFYLFPQLIGRVIKVSLQVYGLVLIGKGNLKGFIIFLITSFLGVLVGINMGLNSLEGKSLLILSGILFLIYSIISISYYSIRKNKILELNKVE